MYLNVFEQKKSLYVLNSFKMYNIHTHVHFIILFKKKEGKQTVCIGESILKLYIIVKGEITQICIHNLLY